MSDDSERRDGAWADGYNTAVLRALELGLLYPETVDWAREALAETLTHAKAEAWDEGWSERDGYCSEPFPPPRDNPYRGEHA